MMQKQINKKRLRIFRVLMFSFPVLFFIILEGGLRLFDYGQNLDLFVPAADGNADTDYLMVNHDVAHRYFNQGSFTPFPAHELFLKEKPANGYRIFVLGGSTAAGWPYPNNMMFSRVLNRRLSDAFPEKKIEIINTGIAAVNSFTLLDFMTEVVDQKPDAILIYAGHNEFYGAFGAASTESLGQERWIINSYIALHHLKTVQWLRDLINGIKLESGAAVGKGLPTLMGRMIGEQNVPYGSATYRRAKEHFQANLDDILGLADRAGIPVIISELVSNLRDQAPFISTKTDEYPPADAVYQKARALEAEEKYDQARAAYYKAKDLDALRFRASEEFNEIIRRTASQHNVPLVPMQAYFEKASPNGLIGSNLMLEHLHPNVDGYLLIAEAFFDSLRQHGFISKVWDASRIKTAADYRKDWPITELDQALGKLRIINLMDHWPFTPLSKPGSAFAQYKPTTKAESFAYKIMTKRLGFEQAHIQMAKHYEAAGQYELAFRQYQALINAAPIDNNRYLLAAQKLYESKQNDRALQLLYQSLKLQNTGVANKLAGHILLRFRKPGEAIPFLEKAVEEYQDDAQVLYQLGGAYSLSGNRQKAREILARLEKIQPDFHGIETLGKMIESQ